MKRIRVALARYRLRSHMYGRLIYGGSPDCPCERCTTDKALVLELTGEPWNDPERAAYFRDLEEAAALRRDDANRDIAESRSLTLEEAKERIRKA